MVILSIRDFIEKSKSVVVVDETPTLSEVSDNTKLRILKVLPSLKSYSQSNDIGKIYL